MVNRFFLFMITISFSLNATDYNEFMAQSTEYSAAQELSEQEEFAQIIEELAEQEQKKLDAIKMVSEQALAQQNQKEESSAFQKLLYNPNIPRFVNAGIASVNVVRSLFYNIQEEKWSLLNANFNRAFISSLLLTPYIVTVRSPEPNPNASSLRKYTYYGASTLYAAGGLCMGVICSDPVLIATGAISLFNIVYYGYHEFSKESEVKKKAHDEIEIQQAFKDPSVKAIMTKNGIAVRALPCTGPDCHLSKKREREK